MPRGNEKGIGIIPIHSSTTRLTLLIFFNNITVLHVLGDWKQKLYILELFQSFKGEIDAVEGYMYLYIVFGTLFKFRISR